MPLETKIGDCGFCRTEEVMVHVEVPTGRMFGGAMIDRVDLCDLCYTCSVAYASPNSPEATMERIMGAYANAILKRVEAMIDPVLRNVT